MGSQGVSGEYFIELQVVSWGLMTSQGRRLVRACQWFPGGFQMYCRGLRAVHGVFRWITRSKEWDIFQKHEVTGTYRFLNSWAASDARWSIAYHIAQISSRALELYFWGHLSDSSLGTKWTSWLHPLALGSSTTHSSAFLLICMCVICPEHHFCIIFSFLEQNVKTLMPNGDVLLVSYVFKNANPMQTNCLDTPLPQRKNVGKPPEPCLSQQQQMGLFYLKQPTTTVASYPYQRPFLPVKNGQKHHCDIVMNIKTIHKM